MKGQSLILSHPSRILGRTGAVLYVLFIGLPIIALLVQAAQQSDFFLAVTGETALTALRLSLVTSLISMTIVVLLGTPFAYLLARSGNIWARAIDSLVELPLILPPVVAGVAMLMVFGRNGLLGPVLDSMGLTIPFTTTAVVLAQMFVASPFFIRSAKIGFQSVSSDYEDVAQTLGVSPWKTFFRITLPLASPAMITGLGLAWARALSEFGATMMFAGNLTGETQTMPLAIMSAMESNLDSALAMSVLLLAGSIIVLVIQGQFTRRKWQSR